MNDTAVMIITALVGGGLVSLLFYGGLWLTLNFLGKSERPGTMGTIMLLSFLGRSAGAVAVLIVVARLGSWPAVLGATGITIIARMAITRRLKQRGGEVQS